MDDAYKPPDSADPQSEKKPSSPWPLAVLSLMLFGNVVRFLMNSEVPFPSVAWIAAVAIALALVMGPGAIVGILIWAVAGPSTPTLRSACVWSSAAVGVLRLVLLA